MEIEVLNEFFLDSGADSIAEEGAVGDNDGGTAAGAHALTLPSVFAPYTSIPTNLMFFDRSGPTKDVWYYEQPLPNGRKNYTKTQPIQFEEFADCLAWWQNRQENDRAWKISAKDLLEYNSDGTLKAVNLDRKNPNAASDFEHLPPEQLADDILKKEQRIMESWWKSSEHWRNR